MKKIYLFKMFLMAFVLMLLGGVNASAEEVSLSQTNIYNGGTDPADGYGKKTLTDENGNTWNAFAICNYHSKATNTQYYLQIKKYDDSNTAYYIQVPALGSKITKIEMTTKPIFIFRNPISLLWIIFKKTGLNKEAVRTKAKV